METWFYGINPDFSLVRQTSLQVIKEIAEKVAVLRQDILCGTIMETGIKQLKVEVEKSITIQA